MSRRESTIKSIAGGLQAKSLDLTKHARARVASRVRDPLTMRTDEAAGALAFAANDRILDGEQTYGDPLAGFLLRLKYADQHAKDIFDRASLILMHRYAGLATKKSETMYAIITVALFEWIHDSCSRCRTRRAGVIQPRPCPDCADSREADPWQAAGRRDTIQIEKGGKRIERAIATPTARIGCLRCHGLKRIFTKERKAQGVRCVSCRNSGRADFKHKRRWSLVNDILLSAQNLRGQLPDGIGLDNFHDHWLKRYYMILNVLRDTDKNIVAGVDLGLRASHNRATQQKQNVGSDDLDAPAEARGEDVT